MKPRVHGVRHPRRVESGGVHLKALTLRGFKSFASATTLRFEPGITCVVGPNGSGKSNVVDALSWVMGEQGAKSLRGGKMEDVIFAGTTGRPPLGRAEVSLTIDNSDGALPIEYAEVTITRIMFRNGGSEYQINGDTCRLLDIQELLSDSGIGREMHVIVGQGQLDSVLHADPMGRRAFIEEAAGVLKHRKRKEKALRKLDAMQANLARVQDLTDELRRQLKPLGRQAAVARRAAVIQADLRDARLRLLADDLVRLREALKAEIADEAALKERKEAAEQELKKALQREALLEDEVRAGLRLNDEEARAEVRALVEERTASIPAEDLHVLGYYEWLEGLERGIAAHHAGMLPTFKEVVEELFVRGLVKAVFATETLALGINMPARSVVLEKLVKWNGEQHADITPGEYTQLTGRAGRRGIDVEGHAVVLWQRGMNPEHLAGLAGTRTYPLRSSFKPSYNMAVNLVEQFGRHRSRELLETSFAQFQADKSVVGISRQVQRNEEGLEGYKASMTCHLGDFEEYARLRRELKDRETELARQGAAQRRAEAAVALEKLKPGDIIHVPTGKYAGLALVLDPGLPAGRTNGHRGLEYHDGPRPLVLTAERQVKRLASIDFPVPVEALERMWIPKSFNPRSPQSRRDLASALRTKAGHIVPDRRGKRRSQAADDREIARLRKAIRAHPCHGCDDREDHARWAERYHRLLRDTSQLERRIEGRTNTIARTFDRIVALLTEMDYLRGDEVTEDGKRLARLYGELDLLASECLREGVWEGLGPAELAACVSALVYEARVGDDALAPKLPSGKAKAALGEMVRIWGRLDALEEEFRITQTEGVGQREPDLGFAWAAYMWASGKGLDEVLREAEMPAGDFVRWCKQVIDVLGQISAAAPAREGSTVAKNARKAVDGLLRGVVAYSSVG
ncbi:AAA family ATPase [Streptomyces sp. NPDC052013]|uniref:AAA family ATPase n=1 Tax=Streptomyces sp. NPDC052013 TaxID=3365679 RepID=UPI0037D6A590